MSELRKKLAKSQVEKFTKPRRLRYRPSPPRFWPVLLGIPGSIFQTAQDLQSFLELPTPPEVFVTNKTQWRRDIDGEEDTSPDETPGEEVRFCEVDDSQYLKISKQADEEWTLVWFHGKRRNGQIFVPLGMGPKLHEPIVISGFGLELNDDSSDSDGCDGDSKESDGNGDENGGERGGVEESRESGETEEHEKAAK